MLCYAALADLFKYLPESKADPGSVDVRQRLQVASWMSIWPMKREKYRYGSISTVNRIVAEYLALNSALGLSHALGHKLGARYGIPHGITSVSGSMPYTD